MTTGKRLGTGAVLFALAAVGLGACSRQTSEPTAQEPTPPRARYTSRDGTFTVYFGSKEICGDVPNRLDVPEGWNYMLRVYRPDASVLNGGYVLPGKELVKR